MKNILINFFKENYFLVIVKKIFKKFEKNTSVEAKKWAVENNKRSIEEFFCSVDAPLYDEIKIEIKSIQEFAQNKISKLTVPLGGGGNYILLYFLIRKFKLFNIVETGVAAGWTSLAILRALKKNGKGFLYSSDFPYFRLRNPEKYIGIMVPEELKKNWRLEILGDEKNIKKFKLEIDYADIILYDSDKRYSGKINFFKAINNLIRPNSIIVVDDLHNDSFFLEYVNEKKCKNWFIVESKRKHIVGIILPD